MILANRVLISLFLFLLFSCQEKLNTFYISGYTQGTTYNIKYNSIDNHISKTSIDSLLQIIDLSMSSYISNSTISKINKNLDVKLDSLIYYVIDRSIEICDQTNGMFDITVAPIVNDWGFGPQKKYKTTSSINVSLYELGCDKIRLENSYLIKSDIVKIDLNGIAQGFSVDYLSDYFKSKGVEDFMIEIGGEITCSGNNLNKGWKIGVDAPHAMIRTFAYILNLNNISLATSGSYRNYYYSDSIKISHTINPKIMAPARNQLLSATILSADCLSADAYATACMSFGLEEAKEFLIKNDIIGSLIYVQDKDTLFYFSDQFASFLHRSPGSAPQ